MHVSNAEQPPAARRTAGIRTRLIGLVLVAVTPFLILVARHTQDRLAERRRAAQEHALALARLVAARVDDHVRTVDALLLVLSHSASPDPARTAFNDSLLAALRPELPPTISNVLVFAPDGRNIGVARDTVDRAQLDASGRKYLLQALAGGTLVTGEVVRTRRSGLLALSLARPMRDARGRVVAVVAAASRLERLQGLLEPGSLPAGAIVTVVNDEGMILARSAEPERWVGRRISDAAQARERIARREGIDHKPGLDGVRRLSGFSATSLVPWYAYVGLPEGAVEAGARQELARALTLGAGTLAIALVLVWLLAGRITDPLRSLAADAAILAGGELAHRTRVTSPDETGALASAFNRMAAALEQRGAALADSERRYRTLFDTCPVPMWVYDVATLDFLAVNDAAVRHYGWSRDEFLAMSIADIRPPEDAEALMRQISAVRSSVARTGGAWRHRRKDGSVLEVEIASNEMMFDGRPARLVVAADITERRHAEAALRESQERLRQSQKMEAVGQLAGGVAHDFNNLLTAILGYCELILTEPEVEDTVRHDVGEIRDAAKRAASLTQQLLAFSRRQMLQPRVLDVDEVVAGLENMLRRLLGEDVVLEARLAASPAVVLADRGQLEQVVVNLAVNARDAMPEGGRLTIATARVVVPGNGAGAQGQAGDGPAALAPGAYVQLTVRDTGTGMDEAVRTRIFEPFFTTKERGKGTGLGLSTVYGIVQQSNGQLAVESTPGHGSTFHIWLPCHAAVGAEESPAPPAAPPDRGTETVLLAEDDAAVREVVRMMLEREGYTVFAAASGAEALAIAARHAGAIDLLLTDLVMPGMSGRELAERMAEARPGTPVLYASGYTEDAIVRRGVLEEGMPYLQKPFDPAALGRALRSVLDASATGVRASGALERAGTPTARR